MASTSEARNAFAAFAKALPTAIIRGLRRGLRIAERRAKTVYFQRGDNRHPTVWDPPNRPPGPLKIRSGDLIRTVGIAPMRYTGRQVIGGLKAGGGGVRYAAIHEDPKGFGFNRAGRGHRSVIPARPYLRPALDDTQEEIEREVAAEMFVAARATLQGIARGL